MPIIEHVEGFDVVSASRVFDKYAPYVSSGGGQTAFAQRTIISGRYPGGNALRIDNAGEALFTTRTLPASTKRMIGIAYSPVAFNLGSPVVMLRFQFGNTTQVAVQANGDHLRLSYGGNGGAIDGTPGINISDVLTPNTGQYWYILIAVDFAAAGSIKTKVYAPNGDIFATSQPVINTVPHPGTCDRVSLRWAAGQGVLFDDWYVARAEPSETLDDLLAIGPCRVITGLPAADYQAQMTPLVPGSHFVQVNERNIPPATADRPDGNSTYLRANDEIEEDLFTFAETDCVGLLWAVALNAAIRVSTPGQAVRFLVYQPGVGQLNFGSGQSSDLVGYQILQGITQEDPAVADHWTEASVLAAAWGVGAADLVRISSVFMEKLVSLNPALPFDCGSGGNYAY